MCLPKDYLMVNELMIIENMAVCIEQFTDLEARSKRGENFINVYFSGKWLEKKSVELK